MGLGWEFGRPGYSSCYSLRGPFSIHSNPEHWHYAKSSQRQVAGLESPHTLCGRGSADSKALSLGAMKDKGQARRVNSV